MRLRSIRLAGSLAVAVSAVLVQATAAPADAAPYKSRSYCRSASGAKTPRRTAPLERAFARIAAKRNLGVSLLHLDRSLVCGAHAGAIVGTASTSKPLIVATLFEQRAGQDRKPARTELALARRSIRSSDHDATHRLWRIIGGGKGLGRFARSVGLSDLTPTRTRNWGSNTLSAATLTAFSRLLITPGSRIGRDAAAFILGNMRHVAAGQRWGLSAGAGPQLPRGGFQSPVGRLFGEHRDQAESTVGDSPTHCTGSTAQAQRNRCT